MKEDKAEAFHTTTAQGLFLTKRARPDIHTGITFLCTWVCDPNEEDWEKIIKLMKCLNGTRDLDLTLCADQLNILKWYVDTAFAVATKLCYGPSFLWRNKVTRLMRIFSTKTTRVQFCWRKMVERVQPSNHMH